VIERFRDKSLLKAWLRAHGTMRVNRGATVTTAEEAIAFQADLGTWPVVVKPTGGAGSMAVFFANDHDALLSGCQEVLERGLGDVLLEEYVGGTEFAVNGIVDHRGVVLVTEVWRYDRRDSHGERNLYYETLKVSTHEAPFADVAAYAAEVLGALGLRRSPFHMEVKVDEDGPCIIEVGARFAGGHQPVLGSLLHHHSLFELAACHYLADLDVSPDDVDFAHYDRHSARIVSGIQEVELPSVTAVLGLDEVQRLPSFQGTGMLRRPGMRVAPSKDVNTKAWEVYLFHEDAAQVAADARAARALLRYV
jgi:biotin carboxylase